MGKYPKPPSPPPPPVHWKTIKSNFENRQVISCSSFLYLYCLYNMYRSTFYICIYLLFCSLMNPTRTIVVLWGNVLFWHVWGLVSYTPYFPGRGNHILKVQLALSFNSVAASNLYGLLYFLAINHFFSPYLEISSILDSHKLNNMLFKGCC